MHCQRKICLEDSLANLINCLIQVASSPYKGILDCAARTLREDGLSTFYRSYRTTVRKLHSNLANSLQGLCEWQQPGNERADSVLLIAADNERPFCGGTSGSV